MMDVVSLELNNLVYTEVKTCFIKSPIYDYLELG